MESALERIIRKTGRRPVQCKCRECKEQCRTPCLGTPEDILRLIEAGYKDKLYRTGWCVGLILGKTDHTIPMVQALQTSSGCIFFKDGLCELHELGLKPTEGRLSHHSIKAENYKFSKSLSWNVAKEWTDAGNRDIVQRIFMEME